jgi:hypothetical protein
VVEQGLASTRPWVQTPILIKQQQQKTSKITRTKLTANKSLEIEESCQVHVILATQKAEMRRISVQSQPK